jgi:hypothetical protein
MATGPPPGALPAYAPPLVRTVHTHGGQYVDALAQATATLRPRPGPTLGALAYDALAPSLRSGLLQQSTWALNTLVAATSNETIPLPPARPGEPPELAWALVELFWADLAALAELAAIRPLGRRALYATADPTAHATAVEVDGAAVPRYVPWAVLEAAEVDEASTLDPDRHRRGFLVERLISVLVVLRNWLLHPTFRAGLGATAAVATLWVDAVAADWPQVPAHGRCMMRAIAWDALACLGTHTHIPGPPLSAPDAEDGGGDAGPSALEVLIVGATDGLTTLMEMARAGTPLLAQSAADTRTYLDVAVAQTYAHRHALARLPVPVLRALASAAIGLLQPLVDGTGLRPALYVWTTEVQPWIIEVVVLLLLSLVRVPVPAVVVRQHGPIARALADPVLVHVLVAVATRNAATVHQTQRLCLRLLIETAAVREAHPLLARYEPVLLRLATSSGGASAHGRGGSSLASLAGEVLLTLAQSV